MTAAALAGGVMPAWRKPRLYALDEHLPWIEPWREPAPGGEGIRDVSELTWNPGVPAMLELDGAFWHTPVLLDVDTLQTCHLDRAELDGKWELPYQPTMLRQHIERRLVDGRKIRQRHDSRRTGEALRRLAALGAASSQPELATRPHPDHPLDERDWISETPVGAKEGGAVQARSSNGRDRKNGNRKPQHRRTAPANPKPAAASRAPKRRKAQPHQLDLVDLTLAAMPDLQWMRSS